MNITGWSTNLAIERYGDRVRGWVCPPDGRPVPMLSTDGEIARTLLTFIGKAAPKGLSFWRTPTTVVDGYAKMMGFVLVGDVPPDVAQRLDDVGF